jgi:protein TonB
MSTSAPIDRDRSRRFGEAALVSVGVHVLAFVLWGLSYEPRGEPPEPTAARVVKAIGLQPTRKQTPVREPEPKPEPEPSAEPEPAPEPAPQEPDDRPPPPPPPECRGCALLPAELGPRKPSSGGRSIPTGVPGGVPGGVLGGVPGGVPGGVLGGVVGGNPNAIPGEGRGAAPQPLELVMQEALYTPYPDAKLLAKTKTGMFTRNDGTNRTAFCIDEHGKTTAVRTSKAFGGDPQIDQICIDVVKQWRFKPAKLGGRARRVCSVVVFDITFE